jgi:hypothetical protein
MSDMMETVYETIIKWDVGGGKRSRRELARRIVALFADQKPDLPADILERPATRRELPAYMRSVPGVVDLINLKVRS